MRTIPKRFTCPTRNFNVVGLEVNPNGEDAELYTKMLAEAYEQKENSDPRDTSGRVRTEEEHLRDCYLGAVSESLIVKYLQNEFRQEAYVVREPFETYEKHVDIEVYWNNGNKTTLEVRSSFHYASLRNVVCEYFNALGPYRTGIKPGETLKNFYFQGLLKQNFDLNKVHMFHFSGGAPGQWFKERGTEGDLDRPGAEYLKIPLVEVMDAVEIVNALRRHANSGVQV